MCLRFLVELVSNVGQLYQNIAVIFTAGSCVCVCVCVCVWANRFTQVRIRQRSRLKWWRLKREKKTKGGVMSCCQQEIVFGLDQCVSAHACVCVCVCVRAHMFICSPLWARARISSLWSPEPKLEFRNSLALTLPCNSVSLCVSVCMCVWAYFNILAGSLRDRILKEQFQMWWHWRILLICQGCLVSQ